MIIDLSKPRKLLKNKMDLQIAKLKANEKIEYKTIVTATSTALFISIVFAPNVVMAGTLSNKVIIATKPIIELIRALGYPVCLCTMTAGAITMAFNRRKGIQLIKDGAIAYLVIQFVPMIMQLLSGVGDSVK